MSNNTKDGNNNNNRLYIKKWSWDRKLYQKGIVRWLNCVSDFSLMCVACLSYIVKITVEMISADHMTYATSCHFAVGCPAAADQVLII